MSLLSIFVVSFFIVSIPNEARAEGRCSGPSSSLERALACAEEFSPEIQKATLEVDRARAEVGVAGQWKNPEVSAEALTGRSGGGTSSETDLALSVPIEWGGKISARTRAAEGRVAQAEAALFDVRARVRAALMVKLQRLRQLRHEQDVIDESVATFKTLVDQYSRRPQLSPEQQMSVAVFRMSKSEYDLKRAETVEEKAHLAAYFRTHLQSSLDDVKADLPSLPAVWPDVPSPTDLASSPRLQAAQAELRTAQAELSVAQSEAWPTVMLGPSARFQSDNGGRDQLYGFNLSLSLPLFHANGSGRRAAALGIQAAETNRALLLKSEAHLRESLRQTYLQSVAVLSVTLSHGDIEKSHREAEKLFLRGLVPSSLVIEMHRTYVDLEKSRHERELKALESYFEIAILDGKMPEMPQ